MNSVWFELTVKAAKVYLVHYLKNRINLLFENTDNDGQSQIALKPAVNNQLSRFSKVPIYFESI